MVIYFEMAIRLMGLQADIGDTFDSQRWLSHGQCYAFYHYLSRRMLIEVMTAIWMLTPQEVT